MNRIHNHLLWTGYLIFSISAFSQQPPRPKNVILMISDGCGYNQIMATDYYQYGESGKQIYQQFPVHLAMSTYSGDGHGYDPQKNWTDPDYIKEMATNSAASGTAIATGCKTIKKIVGMDSLYHPLETVLERAEKLNKSTGLVTSVEFSHATPACFAAHQKDRNDYEEIAFQLLFESAVDVLMGCGHPDYDNDGQQILNDDKEYKYVGGESVWVQLKNGNVGGDANRDGTPDPWTLIESRDDFNKLAIGKTPARILAIARIHETLQQKRSEEENDNPFQIPFIQTVPILEEMVKGALNVLDNDPDGFFLMIEGGAVDWAGHDEQLGRLIEEEMDFNRAVETICQWVEKNSSWKETLVIVTADHETGYLTGPAPEKPVAKGDYPWGEPVNQGKGNIPLAQWQTGKHTNELVPLFAKGVGSDLFNKQAVNIDPVRGVYCDNTDIAKVIFEIWSE